MDLTRAWSGRGNSRVLGVHVCSENTGHVLLTTTDQVTLLNTTKLSAQGAITLQSWEYRADSSHALSLPAVKHPKLDRFYGIRGKSKRELITWSSETERFNTLEGKKLSNGVFQLHVDGNVSGVLIVGIDGSISISTDDLKFNSLVSGKPETKAVFSHLSTDATQRVYLLVISKLSNNIYEIVSHTIAKEHEKAPFLITGTVRREISSSLDLVSCVPQGTSLSLLWASGEWQTLEDESNQVKDVTTIDIAQVSSTESKRRKVSPASFHATAVSDKSLVIATTSSIQVWNSQYAVHMSSYSFEVPTTVGSFLDVHYLARSSTVVLVHEHSLNLGFIEKTPTTLASVLGKGNTSTSSMVLSTFLPSDPTTVANLVETLQVETWQSTLLSGNEEQLKVLESLTNREKTPTKESFTKIFYRYIYFKTKKKLRAVFSPQFVIQVAKRCVESHELGLWNELSLLIKTKHLCSRSIPLLIPTAMANKQFHIIQDCLEYFCDIDELTLIRICKFILRNGSKKNIKIFSKQKNSNEIKKSSQFIEHFFVFIVTLPKADVFLQNAMQELNILEVLAILTFLKKWYRCSSKPDILQYIVHWMGLLIDVHYTSLVIESDNKNYIGTLLGDLKSMLNKHLDSCHKMADVHGEVEQLLSDSNMKQTGTLPDYSVETLLL